MDKVLHTSPTLQFGCIADDFTGATDLANNLVRAGLTVVQTIGVPSADLDERADAVVISLKSRTTPVQEAVAESLDALKWLRAQGASQFYFKVCSTFDSTDQGNIGPVADALMEEIGCDLAAVCPSFPENHRTVYKGHLFVGDTLLSDSGMRDHPLTPMRDSNLVRVLQRQTKRKVGLVDHAVVAGGSEAVKQRMEILRADGTAYAIVDTLDADDLVTLGAALKDARLVVAGSGLALGLGGGQRYQVSPARLPDATGLKAIVSGSCSSATQGQVVKFLQAGGQGFAVDPLRIAAGENVVEEALAWAQTRLSHKPVLFYATTDPSALRKSQDQLGVAESGEMVERTLAAIAVRLTQRGVRQLVVAGGETSGACAKALGVDRMRIGAQIDPGVPWCYARCRSIDGEPLHIALKSGNFGTPDFFTNAFEVLA